MGQHQLALKDRAGLYSLLRALYTYPLTVALLEGVASLSVVPDSPLAPGLRPMQDRLQTNGSITVTVEDLNTEMTRLLEGPGLTPAPPFGSYYLDEGRLMGPSTVAVRRFYLAWNALPDGEVNLPGDHIALEFGFLAHLAQRSAEVESSDEIVAILTASHDFIRQHLQPWLPLFCNALAEASSDPFFVGLAGFTKAAVEIDLAWLATAVLDGSID
jgi:TorA maturation chaperone TorD